MLACALGIFFMQGVVDVYLSAQKTFALQKAIAHLQENARFATHFLTQNIRMAGELSCEHLLPMPNPPEALRGYQGNPPPTLKNKILAGTDSVSIERCRTNDGSESIEKYAFFISETSRKNQLGKKVYALYESPIVGNKVELVPNVNDMRISYGVMSADGQGVQAYLPADKVSDWKMVKSVEIALLLSSEMPVLSKPESIQFAGKPLPKSRYLHKEWPVYVNLRERHE
ncbi:MAG: hypothetical protein K0Q74_929 [Gammaproteobacteria bacterium]|nr:hypothetical protein [Gammaproteobacteria bacterium]